ncbi:glutathione hydrolase 1 proenzyme-like [Eupeodes corollae]|uniref:glutathione hydrolase 1 proenzyme-like n=1 Tax=Eupeodes corollae TaxID=290404 RepID=UPI00248FC989|nr:glutathione hydrolase 1 proenzyme-like [Eupeodes corollae]
MQDVGNYRGKMTILLVVVVALAGILFHHFQQSTRKEHKCKAAEPQSAEPASLRFPPDIEMPLPPSSSDLHVFQEAAVCSDSEICSRIGRDILQQGGNAVDSALATLVCNGLVTMQSMGIGGGFIMNVFQHSLNHSSTIIARETAPAAVKIDHFASSNGNDQGSNLQGPLSIAVPGEVMGYDVAHRKYGSLPWRRILQPTIDICLNGFQLSKHQWDSLFFNPRIRNDEYLREMFVNKTTGDYNRVGSIVHPPAQLCETYRILSQNGPQDFYTGFLAELIAKDLKDIGSIISLNDLRNYKADVLDSIKLNLGPDVLHLVPPIGSGVVIGQALKILKGYNIEENKVDDRIVIHRIVEALKFGFASRWELGDPDFNDQNKFLEKMLSTEWAEELRLKINDTQAFSDPHYYGGKSSPVDEHGTGHICVLAPNGDAVSVTSTIHYYFGSAIMGKRTGILFNSAMGDFSIPGLENYFSLPPSKANLVQPKKRPMSSMTPTIVTTTKGDVKLVVGGAGGPKIISALVNILVRILWLGYDIKQAIDAPRFHHQLIPNFLEYEFGMLKDVVTELENIGHSTLRYRERGSVFCGIMKNETAVYANADFRKLGGVFGF